MDNYRARSDSALQKAIKRYERALDAKAFQGTIPRYESEYAEACWNLIDDELDHSRELLHKAIERRVNGEMT